jgi:anaerobic ribonucleoside-triphosphate reductase activating protein
MNYCGITAPDIANGTGCRVVLWISGCNHRCNGCHNPETWDYKYGKKFDEGAKNIICQWLSKPYIKGLTISGGDPLDRSNDELLEILDLCIYIKTNFPDKDIWIYSGFTYEQLLEKSNTNILNILLQSDYLVDGPFIKELRDLSIPFRGSTNQHIIDLEINKFHIKKKIEGQS